MRNAIITPINAIGSATRTSGTLDFRQIYRLSGQVVVGAGANTAGSMQLQFSNDPDAIKKNPFAATNWTNFGTPVTVSGAATSPILFSTVPWTDLGFAWLRAVYTDSSSGTGLGLVTVNLNLQGF